MLGRESMHCSGFTEFLSTYDLFCISDMQATTGNLLSKAMSCLKGSDQRFLGLLSPTLVVKTESHVEWFDVVTRPFYQHYIMSITYDHTVSSSITCFISVSFPTIEIKPQLVPNPQKCWAFLYSKATQPAPSSSAFA